MSAYAYCLFTEVLQDYVACDRKLPVGYTEAPDRARSIGISGCTGHSRS
jgi:hypothetical protein